MGELRGIWVMVPLRDHSHRLRTDVTSMVSFYDGEEFTLQFHSEK